MLLRISPDYSAVKDKIEAAVGKTYNLEERKKLGKTSSSNNLITAASIDIHNLLVVNENAPTCTIEMRPKGIIISFRSLNESYALVAPHYKLKIYKGRAEEYSFYMDHQFIKIWAGKDDAELHKFIKLLRRNRADNAPTQVEDLL